MTDAGGSAPAPAGSASSQLRVSLKEKTVSDLIEECKAAGISGYSNKRKEELIDLLVFKKPRLDVAKEESTGNEEASVRLRFFRSCNEAMCDINAALPLYAPLCVLGFLFCHRLYGSQQACILLGVIAMNPTGHLDKR